MKKESKVKRGKFRTLLIHNYEYKKRYRKIRIIFFCDRLQFRDFKNLSHLNPIIPLHHTMLQIAQQLRHVVCFQKQYRDLLFA